MRVGNKGKRGRRKRWSRIRRQLNRLGSDRVAVRGWAKKRAAAIHARRNQHESTTIGRKFR